MTDGWSPLHMAAGNGHYNVVKLILDNEADIDVAMTNGRSPLHMAAQNGHYNVVKLLLEHGAIVGNDDKKGCTPLHLAAESDHIDVVKLLLEHEADVNVATIEGYSPLHIAAQNGHYNVVKLLLDNKADVNVAIIDGCSPLHLAAEHGHYSVVKLLLNHGADVNAKDKAGSTSLLFALKFRHFKVADLLFADPNINIGCIKAASINKENKEGKEKFSQKFRQDYNLFQKVKEASNEKDKGRLDKLLKEIEELLESKNKHGFKPSLNYSPDGNDENTIIEIVIKAGGELLDLLYTYAKKNIGTDTEIFKCIKQDLI
ncbi:hypothetical protein DEJ70_06355 [Wolbachia pipientis wAlbB]|nr:hypothetical protein DEJ70_06355 [Wolbachia pipientis wAlbB]QZA83372.1 ankyrin repeat domain-containing protein [Wolbachia pipientis]THA19894.1 hypothetical protein EJE47_04635 [Wolbachia endosymbiont of Aedes albopictus]UYC24132.1 ankyrin repeat domain-containing protein [Wolbachia endosymbiont of Aedes aegypti]